MSCSGTKEVFHDIGSQVARARALAGRHLSPWSFAILYQLRTWPYMHAL